MDAETLDSLRRIADRIKSRAGTDAERQRQVREQRIEAALAEAHRLVDAFRAEDPGLERVVLFGSLATGQIGNREPDIDLAVESSRYLRLVSIGLDSPFRVDVVDLATVRDSIRAAVDRDGKILYAR